MEKKFLLTPGPTPVPEEVRNEAAKPIIHHRTKQYLEYFAAVNTGLKKVFKTKNDVMTFTSSGTGAMEAAVVNTLSKGDKAIVVRGGKFGERFAEICKAYGVEVIALDIPWGTAPSPKLIQETLDKNKGIKAVFVNLCETSTATAYDVKGIAEVVSRTEAIFVVDTISGLGADTFYMDDWKVDVAVGGSQKGFMIPPGLAFISLSQKAWDMAAKSNLPKFYFDVKKYKKALEKTDAPFTSAITLMIQISKALSMIETEGVDAYVKRHQDDAEYVRSEAKRMGLSIFSQSPSNAVTGINMPEGVDGSNVIKMMKEKGVTVAEGQDTLKGKIIRVAHMGGINRADLEYAMKVLKEVLACQ